MRRASRTAIVIRTSAQSRSSSSEISTSQTQVVRPRWRRRATAWIVPSTIGRRKLVWLERPCAVMPQILDGVPGRHRRRGLGDRGEDAAVDEARRLAQIVADGDLRADLLVRQRGHLQAVEAVEARQLAPGKRGRVHAVRLSMRARMASLEPLAPDQRAVVSLVLQQGRSYDEIAALLGIPPEAVRARAHAGLAALAPANGLPEEITGPLADYLLGQQPPRDAEATRGLLAESAPARGWAAGVAEQLAGVAKAAAARGPGRAGCAAPAAAAGRRRRHGAGGRQPSPQAAPPRRRWRGRRRPPARRAGPAGTAAGSRARPARRASAARC